MAANAGRFKPGQSGNPAGRKPGTTTKYAALRAQLLPHAEELLATVVERAKAGEPAALRLCVERLLPPMKARDEPVRLEGLSGTSSLVDQGQAIVNALAAGEISPGQAASVMQTVANQARIIEVEELERRIAALEVGPNRVSALPVTD